MFTGLIVQVKRLQLLLGSLGGDSESIEKLSVAETMKKQIDSAFLRYQVSLQQCS